jgi:hypothetical protein
MHKNHTLCGGEVPRDTENLSRGSNGEVMDDQALETINTALNTLNLFAVGYVLHLVNTIIDKIKGVERKTAVAAKVIQRKLNVDEDGDDTEESKS